MGKVIFHTHLQNLNGSLSKVKLKGHFGYNSAQYICTNQSNSELSYEYMKSI